MDYRDLRTQTKFFIHELNSPQFKKAKQSLENAKTIEEATKYGGTTVHSFLNAEGGSGHYQEKLKVYGKEGQPCPRCGEDFVKIKISGRGTTYCLHCQKRV